MKWNYIGIVPLMLCVLIAILCIPFMAIGEFADFIADKIIKIGDKIDAWVNK